MLANEERPVGRSAGEGKVIVAGKKRGAARSQKNVSNRQARLSDITETTKRERLVEKGS